MRENNQIRLDVQKLKKIPTLSHTAEKILKMTSKETTHLDELVTIIENDPPIMSKVLSIANIVYLGNLKPITNIKDALFKIGFNTLKNIALSISIFSLFKYSKEKEASYKRLFRHSIATASACQIIAEKYLKEMPEDNFTAGMLHDIGLFALYAIFYREFSEIEQLLTEGFSLKEAEKKVLGTTHGEIGKWLLDFWELPEIFRDVALYHDDNPDKSPLYKKNVALVQVANYIVYELEYTPFATKTKFLINKEKIKEILELPSVEKLIDELKEPLKEVAYL